MAGVSGCGEEKGGRVAGFLSFFCFGRIVGGGGDVRVYENCGRSEGGHAEISKVMSRYSFVHAQSFDSVDQPFEF